MSIDWTFRPSTAEELEQCLADPMWRLCSGALYQIMLKSDVGGQGLVVPFEPNEAQLQLIKRLWHRNIILKARQLGFCVDASTRVLTADLRWVPIGTIEPGTEVVAVDEQTPGGSGAARRMRTATVEAVRRMQAERFRITFNDGRQLVCTDQHPWLSRKAGSDAKWRSLSGEGNSVRGRLKVGTQVRWVTKPWDDPTVEDGWFGGMLDGEGSLALPSRAGASVNVSQRQGLVWDRLERYALERGYHARIEADAAERDSKHGRTPVPKLAFTRMDEMFRLIGQTRPTRFISARWWEGRELPGKRNGDVGWATITSIEPLGVGEVVDMQTSTGTYIAEGFVSHNTTLIALIWLDHALFNGDVRCGIIAQDLDSAGVIFRDKVKLAYDRLPPEIKDRVSLVRDSASELVFSNNSSIRVATSLRSGTIHRLHVSEFGTICAQYPDKANEVVTGSLPTVPTDGVLIIESTAKGRDGAFYKMTEQSRALAEARTDLSQADYRFHFYPWFEDQSYRLAKGDVPISQKDHDYFDTIELEMDVTLDMDQRRWYIAKRQADYSGEEESMWQEFPSTPDEAFKVSAQGTYYSVQLSKARKENRITHVPYDASYPVNTFWDIGSTDGTAVWLHQLVGLQHRFFKFIEDWDQPYDHYTKQLQKMDCMWGVHYLPHDAGHKRQQGKVVQAPIDELRKLGVGGKWVTVPAPNELIQGIAATRQAMSQCYFDKEGCKEGLKHLAGYRKTWNERGGYWMDNVPNKSNGHSEAADGLRQFGQSIDKVVKAASAARGQKRGSGWKYPATRGGSWQGG